MRTADHSKDRGMGKGRVVLTQRMQQQLISVQRPVSSIDFTYQSPMPSPANPIPPHARMSDSEISILFPEGK